MRLEKAEEISPREDITVLVVDDSKVQRRIVSANLSRWGFRVVEAETGKQALDICKAQHVDMVISDWMMPEMNGLEFCEAFRNLERDRYGYFILLTSKNEKNDVAVGLDIGADDFLTKPVNAVELRARIQAGLRLLDMQDQLYRQYKKTEKALDEIQLLYESIDKDLVEAEKLQHSLIPVRERTLPGGKVALHLKSAGHVGGDLAGFFRFLDDRLGIYSIDVSGHGVSSALLTARLAGYMSGHSKAQNIAFERDANGGYQHRSPEQVAHILNQRMLDEMDTDLYFTLAFADIDLRNGHVSMVQAGHPHPVVFDATGEVSFKGVGGPPVGLIEDVSFQKTEFTLRQGDKLMLYTDGITECENPQNELLDDEGLQALLVKHAQGSGLELINDLIWELAAFAQSDKLGDDVSAILFEYEPDTFS
jgi:sigma-B regulation protein RsbU (phosphoserine phosphatase)